MFSKFIKGLIFCIAITTFAFAVRGALRSIFLTPLPPPGQSVSESSPFTIAEAALGNQLSDSYVLTGQDGKPFDVADWFDKPLLVSYVFTNCKQVCPLITKSLAEIISKHEDRLGKDFRVVTIGFDHDNDTTEAMNMFGEKYVSGFDNWRFLTGSKKTVRALADKLGFTYEPMLEGKWKHTIGVTVLAPGGKVFAQVFGQTFSEDQVFTPIDRALEIKG